MPVLFSIVHKAVARAIRQEEEIKDFQIRKEEGKLFADDMILYKAYRNPYTKRPTDFIMVAKHKINIKNQLYFYTTVKLNPIYIPIKKFSKTEKPTVENWKH